jgi:ribosomal protein S18 acetylase RimI-like enzyme
MTKNKIEGGKADKITTLDALYDYWADKGYKSGGISKSLKKQLQRQIQKGVKIEMEHTNDEEKATEITMDHLTEFPDYYDRLDKMEKSGNDKLAISETKKFIKYLLRENIESTHIEIDEEYGYCVGNVHDDISKISNWFSFRKIDFKKYEKFLRKPTGFLNNIYVDIDKKGMGYGNKLYSQFEEQCYSNDAQCIVLECDTGNEQNEGFDLKKWYESFDYEVIGIERGYPIMIKYLV